LEKYIEAFKKENIKPLDSAIKFLKKYGGAKYSDGYVFYNFDPIEAINGRDMYWLKYYEEITKTPLNPIGVTCNDHLILVIDSEGKIYGGFDDYFKKLGDNEEEAMKSFMKVKE